MNYKKVYKLLFIPAIIIGCVAAQYLRNAGFYIRDIMPLSVLFTIITYIILVVSTYAVDRIKQRFRNSRD